MKNEIGLRMAYWFSFSAVAGAFGGLIAFGIQQVHASIANWRLLFIVEVAYKFMPNIALFTFISHSSIREFHQFCWEWDVSFSFRIVQSRQSTSLKKNRN
jgi:MFS family permease